MVNEGTYPKSPKLKRRYLSLDFLKAGSKVRPRPFNGFSILSAGIFLLTKSRGRRCSMVGSSSFYNRCEHTSGIACYVQVLTHKPFTVLQQFYPKFQPAHLIGLKTVAIKAGRVKRKCCPVIKLNRVAFPIRRVGSPLHEQPPPQ